MFKPIRRLAAIVILALAGTVVVAAPAAASDGDEGTEVVANPIAREAARTAERVVGTCAASPACREMVNVVPRVVVIVWNYDFTSGDSSSPGGYPTRTCNVRVKSGC